MGLYTYFPHPHPQAPGRGNALAARRHVHRRGGAAQLGAAAARRLADAGAGHRGHALGGAVRHEVPGGTGGDRSPGRHKMKNGWEKDGKYG